MPLFTKKKRNAWYREASNAYKQGYLSIIEKDYIGTNIPDTITASVCFRRGREDAQNEVEVKTYNWPEFYRLPIDLWSEVLARKLQPKEEDLF